MSLDEFFHMGGYAAYVWSSYAITLLVLVFNVVLPIVQRRGLIKQLVAHQKRQQRQKYQGKRS